MSQIQLNTRRFFHLLQATRYLINSTFLVLILSFLLVSLSTQGQQIDTENQRISLKDESGSTVFSVTSKYQTASTQLEKSYFWYKSREIHSSKGGFSGKLLHGDYTSYYEDMSLLEKGEFRKGLKHGEWLKWHQNGEMAVRKTWKKGKAIKRAYHYSDHGNLERIVRYRQGVPRKIWYYRNDTLIKKEKYRNGRIKREIDYLEKDRQKDSLKNEDREPPFFIRWFKKDEAEKDQRQLERLKKRQEKQRNRDKKSDENPKSEKKKFLFFGRGENENK